MRSEFFPSYNMFYFVTFFFDGINKGFHACFLFLAFNLVKIKKIAESLYYACNDFQAFRLSNNLVVIRLIDFVFRCNRIKNKNTISLIAKESFDLLNQHILVARYLKLRYCSHIKLGF